MASGFNSSVGILVVRTRGKVAPAHCVHRRFNSSVGILVVRTNQQHQYRALRRCFNSSVGILVVRTSSAMPLVDPQSPFQFLGRNSGRSDTETHPASQSDQAVSIPRSEFWSFGQRVGIEEQAKEIIGFNSSVGILVVRTCPFPVGFLVGLLLVSIPRSEFWSFGLPNAPQWSRVLVSVSIPRSEFWSFGLPVLPTFL